MPGLVCLGSNQGVSGRVEHDCVGLSASFDSLCFFGKGPLQDQRKTTLTTATSIVVANMIGTGVLTSLGFQVVDIKSGFSLLMIWLIGGLLPCAEPSPMVNWELPFLAPAANTIFFAESTIPVWVS